MPASSRRAEMVLLLASVVVALVVAEGVTRLLGAGAGKSGYAPVKTGRRDRAPINALGYRDLERVQPKPAGVRRLVCLGDSFTWGVGVLFDDAWPQRVERTLSRTRHERWEAVNLAEPGMNAVEQVSRLESEGFGYQPDVVVLAWVLNDSEDEDAAEARRARDWAEAKRRKPGLVDALAARSALVRLVRTRVDATLENRRRISGYLSMYADGYPGWEKARRALVTMGGLCRGRGVPFVVVIFPLFANPLDQHYPFAELHAKVAQAAGEAGAKVVDLLPSYRTLDWRLLVVDGTADEHPNEIAHRIAAQAIARAMDEVVPRPAAPPPPAHP
jgi:GDSL-like Lipase/Acylhydrolase family